ncbi:MAG: hypothetical protein GY733_06550 [bacterium]|nr:hypothetical protein [bacterium]
MREVERTGEAVAIADHSSPTLTTPAQSPRLGKAERKYLERHAEPEAGCAAALAQTHPPYPAVLVIPSYGEHDLLLQTLASVPLCAAEKSLVVLVVNQRDDSPDWARHANRTSLDQLRSDIANEAPPRPLGANVQHLAAARFDMVLIDRTQPGQMLPPRQGVGLARKIGSDFALGLWAAGGSKSPWIHCSDADAVLPADYFERPARGLVASRNTPRTPAAAALVYDFRHACDSSAADDCVVTQYEIFLRYYVLGLRSAGSPWAFHTIGSTLAIDARAYAQVRGFPKREAAEDFHLLAKLAKVGRIEALHGEPIVLSGRESERVPFGTGRAVALGRARAKRREPFPTHDPRSFAWLGVWLAALRSLAREPRTPIPHLLDLLTKRTEVDPVQLERLLGDLGAIEAAQKTLQRKGDTLRSLNEHFDALETLKLIHALRDRVYPDIPLDLALQQAPFIDHDAAASLEQQRADLARLEGNAPEPRPEIEASRPANG